MSDEITARNRAIAIEAITGVFIKRDTDVPQKLFDTNYTQHNPTIANGSVAIPELIRALPAEFTYKWAWSSLKASSLPFTAGTQVGQPSL